MLKPRVVAILVVRHGVVVQSIGFNRYLPIGSPAVAVEFLDSWGIDEIIALNIDAARLQQGPDLKLIAAAAQHCHVPLTFGGGIRSVADMEAALRAGADKVSVNTAVHNQPELVADGARFFGSQCIVASMDIRREGTSYRVYTDSGRQATGHSPVALAKRVAEEGAGEILLNSVDRDGCKAGYDTELVSAVVGAVSVPVIACGGVGHPQHLLEGIRLGAAAVAAGNFWHFTEHSVTMAKSFLSRQGVAVRLDSYATYEDTRFDRSARLVKRDDDVLEDLRFKHIPEEVI